MKSSMIRVLGGSAFVAAIFVIAASVSAQVSAQPAFVAVSAVSVATSSCPLSLGFMKLGAANKTSDVAKLQAFLKDSQGSDVDVTGIFDQKTADAVSVFQRAHMSDVMNPWGATQSSGIVYITTAKEIDKIACNVALALNSQELAIIESYKAAADAAMAQNPDGSASSVSASSYDPSAAGPSVDVSSLSSQYQPAAAAKSSGASSSVFTRFVSFLKRLF